MKSVTTLKVSMQKTNKVIVIDTPNLIFSKKFRLKDIIEAIISFILNKPESVFILLITPKMTKQCHHCVTILKQIERLQENVYLLTSPRGVDPDLYLLYQSNNIANNTDTPVLVVSNDKFRKRHYKNFLGNVNTIRFCFCQSTRGLVIKTLPILWRTSYD